MFKANFTNSSSLSNSQSMGTVQLASAQRITTFTIAKLGDIDGCEKSDGELEIWANLQRPISPTVPDIDGLESDHDLMRGTIPRFQQRERTMKEREGKPDGFGAS